MSNEPEKLIAVLQSAQKRRDVDGTVHARPEKRRAFRRVNSRGLCEARNAAVLQPRQPGSAGLVVASRRVAALAPGVRPRGHRAAGAGGGGRVPPGCCAAEDTREERARDAPQPDTERGRKPGLLVCPPGREGFPRHVLTQPLTETPIVLSG